MPNLNELNPTDSIKLLNIGDSGQGKTVSSCSFPGPVKVLDFDNKVSSAAAFYKGTNKLNEIEYENYAPIDSKGTAFKKCNNDLEKMKKERAFPKTLVIDSLTTFCDEVMRYLIAMNPGIKRLVTRGSQVPSQQDYGVARQFFKEFIQEVINFPCHIIFTAHINVDKDETTGQILRTPMMPGKLAREVNIFFPEVYRAYTRNGKHYWQTQADKNLNCRTELGLPAEIEQSYDAIIKNAK